MTTDATLDMKKLARDTTFQMHLKVKNQKWWSRRVWVVSLFTKLMRFLLGVETEITVDFVYDSTD